MIEYKIVELLNAEKLVLKAVTLTITAGEFLRLLVRQVQGKRLC